MMNENVVKSIVLLNTSDSICSSSNSSSSSSSSTSSNNILGENGVHISTTDNDDYDCEDNVDILFPLMQFILHGRRRHRVRNYVEIIDAWSEVEFREHLRLKRDVVHRLIDELEISGYIPSHNYGMRKVSAKWSFLIFLWFLSNTEPLRTLADRFDVSISSAYRIIRRVTMWLLSKIDDVIKWPGINDINNLSNKFFHKAGMHKVIGAIDDTHINILSPIENANDYYNRKKYHSIILQAVADSDMKFTNVYCEKPGSLHDARVLRRSDLYRAATENMEILFPNETFIVGDSAYPSLPWLIPPSRDNGHLTPQQIEFNFMLSSTRMAIEKAFGLLKSRFRRIKFFSEYRDIQFITEIVIAACVLHNICISENDVQEIDEPDVIDDNEDEGINIRECVENVPRIDRRRQLFMNMFPHFKKFKIQLL